MTADIDLTFSDFLQTPSYPLPRSTDNVYGGNTAWFLQMIGMESFQGGNTKFIGAAEEDAQRVVGLGGVESPQRLSCSQVMPAEAEDTSTSNSEHG